jgi:hypothetical protein
MDVVKQNINTVNELIDSHNPRTSILSNDTITDLIKNLRSMEEKLRKLIAEL